MAKDKYDPKVFRQDNPEKVEAFLRDLEAQKQGRESVSMTPEAQKSFNESPYQDNEGNWFDHTGNPIREPQGRGPQSVEAPRKFALKAAQEQSQEKPKLSDEDMAKMEIQGQVKFLDPSAPKAAPAPKMTDEEMARVELDMNASGQRNERVGKEFRDGIDPIGAAKSGFSATSEFYKKDTGWLEDAFYAMTIPEQFIARQTIAAMEDLNMLTVEDARDMLSRDQVHGSDIVNYYWRDHNAQSFVGKTGRFVVGLAADILLDPLSYVGIGALTQAGKTAVLHGTADVAAKSMKHVSKAERHMYKTMEQINKVIKSDGALVEGADDLADIAARNELAIAKAWDARITNPEDVKKNLMGLKGNLEVNEKTKQKIIELVDEGMTEKSWAKEWHEGQRGFTLGARIPFTDVGFEVDFPAPLNKLVAFPINALDSAYDFSKTWLRETSPFADSAFNLMSQLGTRTGKVMFDLQQNFSFGSTNAMKDEVGQFKGNAYKLLAAKKLALGEEKFAELRTAILEELENPAFAQEEAERLAKVFNKSQLDVDDLMAKNTTPEALKRAELLDQHPEIMWMIDDMSQMMKDAAREFKARKLPFEELNPFGKDWASGYLKHRFSEDFLRKIKETDEANDVMGEAMRAAETVMGSADRSSKARASRESIKVLNERSMAKWNVKMFVDDPVELIAMRKEEMHNMIRQHDLLEAASEYAVVGKNPGVGYVEFDVNDYKHLAQDESDQFAAKWEAFIPQFYKQSDSYYKKVGKFPEEGAITTDALTSPEGVELLDRKVSGSKIYLPEDVADRLDFSLNGWKISRPMQKILSAADFYTNVWRNNALFGPGYIGLNAFSNAITYLSFNDRGGPKALAKATAALMPGFGGKNLTVKVKAMGEELPMEEAMKLAYKYNLLNSAFTRGVEFTKMAEHVAGTREARTKLQKGWDGVKTVADYAYLWRANRATAQFADEVPKLATFFSRLEKGYSPMAAAEAAERYFYNFNNMSRIQSATAKIIPFSSFPMKTAELVKDTLLDGKLAALAIPGKVQAALDGAFVQDHEARGALDQMLPSYAKTIIHPIHGELAPGMREIAVDIPWTYATIDTLFHPEKANHPIAQILMLAGSYNSTDEEQWTEGEKNREMLMASNLDMIIPAPVRDMLTLAEINGALNMGGFYKDRYLPTMPTESQVERAMGDRQTGDKGTIVQRFNNAAEFGRAMDAKYGDNWLYNMAFYGRVEGDDSPIGDQEAAARGEFIRKRFRQFSLGLARMNKLDSTFFMTQFAIKRQIDIKTRKLKAEIVQSGALYDTEKLSHPQFIEKLESKYPQAKEILALHYKKDASQEYYDFFLGADKDTPGVGLIELITGADEYEYDFGDQPEKEVYEKLYKGKTMENIPDEDAEELVQEYYDEESL